MRRFLRAALGAHGYRLVEADDRRSEGLAQAAARNPDVILLDLGLPDRDGLEVDPRAPRVERDARSSCSRRAGQEQDKVDGARRSAPTTT